MIWKELEDARIGVISHAVQFNALMIVYVHVFGLSYSEHLIILQEANVSDFVAGLKFHDQVLALPFEHC